MTAHENNTGWRRIVNAFFYSMNGFRSCLRTEEAFRQEMILAAVMIPLGAWLGESAVEKLMLCGVVVFVLIVELLNTGIERAIDRISFERHELSKEAKDMGSAAVLLSLLLAGGVWAGLLLPRLLY